MTFFKSAIGVSLLFIATLPRELDGHSFLIVPRGDFGSYNKPECRVGGPPHAPNDNCRGPCISKTSWQYDTKHVRTKYRRGQVVSMVWTRNNHVGGFVRFTLVPEKDRMNATAHALFSFRHACFEADGHQCTLDTSKERRCGTDKILYRADVQIPTIFPDGKYVLGWSWYGGLAGGKSYFSDYRSCSNVQISGGPLTDSYKPVFKPGKRVPGNNPKNPTCNSSVNRIGVCAKEPCLNIQGRRMKPAAFGNGNNASPILGAWLPGGKSSSTPKPKTPMPSPTSTPTPYPIKDTGDRAGRAQITNLLVVDTATNKVFAKQFNREIQIPKSVKGFTFVALTKGSVQSVTFYLNNRAIRTEKTPPYSSFGNSGSKLYPWKHPIYSEWFKLNATATGADHSSTKKVAWIKLAKA